MRQPIEITPPAGEPVSLGEVRSYLRIETDIEDARLAAITRTARETCEVFIGAALMTRVVRWRSVLMGPRFYLRGTPVGEIMALRHYALDTTVELDLADYPPRHNGDKTFLKMSSTLIGTEVEADYQIGACKTWNSVPEPLRQGMLRLIAHMHEHRSDPAVSAIPPAVTALWQPYRRLRV